MYAMNRRNVQTLFPYHANHPLPNQATQVRHKGVGMSGCLPRSLFELTGAGEGEGEGEEGEGEGEGGGGGGH
jgi:hypothetical protein